MADSRPFVDMEAGEIETAELWAEAAPIALLIGVFGAIAMGVFLVGFFLSDVFGFAGAWLGAIAARFVLAVGAGVVLLYVVVRGRQLAAD